MIAASEGVERPDHVVAATASLCALQQASGCWEGEVVWNTLLLSQYVFVRSIVAGKPATQLFDDATRARMVQYFRVSCGRDGGWGMHPESGPYVFFTAMAYVALRLLGVSVDDPLVAGARGWLRAQRGGVLAIPSWGKFWLAVLGLYGYEGVNPVVPELFVLPEALPIHPNRYYCHTRYILPRNCVSVRTPVSSRPRPDHARTPAGAIRPPLRVDRFCVAPTRRRGDRHLRPSGDRAASSVRRALSVRAGPFAIAPRRGAVALPRSNRIRGPCEQPSGTLPGQRPAQLPRTLRARSQSPRPWRRARKGSEGWRWDDRIEGIRYAGARSNAWDTAFAMRACLETPDNVRAIEAIRRAYAYLRETQLTTELPGGAAEARDPVVGGWCFSDGQHRWPVSDCTAEALSAILIAHESPGLIEKPARFSDHRLQMAVEFILRRQNADGGFPTYERRRGGAFLESLNPSEMFGYCMTERSYIECTASCVSALARYRTRYPNVLTDRVRTALARGIKFLRGAQHADGSWSGFWGVNFSYAIFHVVEALRHSGATADDPAIARAAQWLLGHLKLDGSWGEHYSSCLSDLPVRGASRRPGSDDELGPARAHEYARGARRCCHARDPMAAIGPADRMGRGPNEAVNGVFFGTAMLRYCAYKSYFPAWTLARHATTSSAASKTVVRRKSVRSTQPKPTDPAETTRSCAATEMPR